MAKFLLRRLIAIPVSFVIITALLYGVLSLAPPEARARLYLPRRTRSGVLPHQEANMIRNIIERHGLNDPFPVQYSRWLVRLVRGDWGWSPTFRSDVLPALVDRTPATAELTLFSLALVIPLGLIGGTLAGWRRGRWFDRTFRAGAYLGSSIPPFILGMVLLSLFYVGVRWFPPDRLDPALSFEVYSPDFNTVTGLLLIDGLLNGRPDITLNALQHLILPGITLSLVYIATLGRITRASLIEEVDRDYIVAGRARGLTQRSLVWRHAFPNAAPPSLTAIGLSAAALVTGVYIVEAVFNWPGVSKLAVRTMAYVPDVPMAMGFAVYSVIVVLMVMLLLDVIQALINPRIRRDIEG